MVQSHQLDMNEVTQNDIQKVRLPLSDSHKGQNGRLLVIGGSHFFHAASLWSLTVASRIVDLVHYASVPENNEIVQKAKEEFRNGIVVPRSDIERYIEEDDVILIGPGMMRVEVSEKRVGSSEQGVVSSEKRVESSMLNKILEIDDEGSQTRELTHYVLKKYPEKQWVIDAGALQMVDVRLIPKRAILTPHHGEFTSLVQRVAQAFNRKDLEMVPLPDQVSLVSELLGCIVLVKGKEDIALDGSSLQKELRIIRGGNEGMTKGGTGDVLAGLIAALACMNDPFLSTIAGSYINKKAGEELYNSVGPFFNATDLANQIPKTMKDLLIW